MSVALFRRRAASALSPERQGLADAIRAVADARAAIETTARTRSEATDAIYAARDDLDEVQAAREATESEAVEFVRARAAGRNSPPPGLESEGPSLDQREAKAQREIETWRAIREAAEKVAQEQAQALRLAELAVDRALAAVVTVEAEPAVSRLVQRLATLEAEAGAIRAGLHELYAATVPIQAEPTARELRGRIEAAMGRASSSSPRVLADFAPAGYERDPVKLLMGAALGQLKVDANAPLPTADEIRRVTE